MSTLRPAAFLDRDGTLIHDAHYLRDPAKVALLPDVAEPLRALAAAGFVLVVITNQSGIARGLLTEMDYQAVRARLDALLAAEGVTLAGSYHCPHEPERSGPCECRKPGTLLHRRAASDHGLDVARSVFIGDRYRDIAPAQSLGGLGILVPGVDTPPEEITQAEREAARRAAAPAAGTTPARATGVAIAPSLRAAVTLVLDPRGA